MQPVSPLLLSQSVRFSGYRVNSSGVRFFVPGRQPAQEDKVSLEYVVQGEKLVRTKPLQWTGAQWELPEDKSLKNDGLLYRFVNQNGEAILDNTQTVTRFEKQWNVIPKNSMDPASTGPTLLVFRDSLVTPEQLAELSRLGDTVIAKRTHFNRLGGTDKANPFLRDLYRTYGMQIVEDRPLIGGDNIGAHGYWTTSLFQPNAIVSSASGFEKLALDNLEDGARMCFDGAFVNEGFNGVHYLANLYYGHSSPFLHWFNYGQLNQFPYQPLKLGLLPVKANDEPNENAWDIRFIKPHTPEGPYFVELYDPRIEDKHGKPLPPDAIKTNFAREGKEPVLTNSQDSVQKYRFPISRKEYDAKTQALQTAARISNAQERKETLQRLKSEWRQFEFTTSIHDNSGYNWDGQRDVKKINIQHPEVAAYVRDACVYWTDKVDRLYTRHVAEALQPAFAKTHDWQEALQNITKEYLGDNRPGRVLPALNAGEAQPWNATDIAQALTNHQRAQLNQKLPASRFLTRQLKTHFNLATLPAPIMMQVIFNTPQMQQLLRQGHPPRWLAAVQALFQPVFATVDKVFNIKKPCASFMDKLHGMFSQSFYTVLEKKLENSLSPALKEKLRDPLLGHMVYEQLGRSVFLSLMTGKLVSPLAKDADLNAATIEKRMAHHLPAHVWTALSQGTPHLAAGALHQFLYEQLGQLDTQLLNADLETMVQDITPEAAVVSRFALHQRRLGLHWRIDAMKDIGDMDAVRAEPDALKTSRLTREVQAVKTVMGGVSGAIRQVFPTSVIKGEITDLHSLASPGEGEVSKELLASLMENNLINGMPNYTWLYATGHKAVAMAQQPDSEGEDQLTVSQLIEGKVKPMMAQLPLEQTMMFQNMTSNHDKSTSLYSLVLNPRLARADYYRWLGLNHKTKPDDEDRGFFHLALNELRYKQQVSFLAPSLPQNAFDALKQWASHPSVLDAFHTRPELKETVLPYLADHSQLPGRIPDEAKHQYLDTLFERVTPQQLGLSQEQHQQMRDALKQLLTEPSEVKAMRGKLCNTFRDLHHQSQELSQLLNNVAPVQQVLQELQPALADKALWELGQQHGRWLGYQQLDYVIGWTVDAMAEKLPQNAVLKQPKVKEAVKQALYNIALRPALEQYQRMAALQVALPGDPTFYLPDLLGQAGGEDRKNMYIGNRELIRYDWLEKNPVIKQHYDALSAIVRQRHENHVLNNGHLEFPLDPSRLPEEPAKALRAQMDETSILPLIRDNGSEQAICLVNLGKPKNAWWSWMDHESTPQFRERYPEMVSERPTYHNYKLDLSQMKIPVGTRYRSADAEGKGQEFVVNSNYQLVRADNPAQGVDIRIARTLVRV